MWSERRYKRSGDKTEQSRMWWLLRVIIISLEELVLSGEKLNKCMNVKKRDEILVHLCKDKLKY